MRHLALALISTCIVPVVRSQSRTIDLTGRPAATIDEPFTTIAGLHEVAPGRVVINDMQEQRLVLADFGARSISNVGTKGGGPGEWQFPMGILPGPNNQAMVIDPGLRKLHLVNAAGKIVGTRDFPGGGASPGRISMTVPSGSDSRGRIFFTGARFAPGQAEQPDSVPIIRWDPASGRLDSLGKLANETRVTQSGGSGSTRIMARVGGGPMSPSTSWTALPDGGVAIVYPAPYRVDFVSPTGTLTRGTPVPFTPIKVTSAERDAYRERQASAPGMTIRATTGGAPSFSAGAPSGTQPEIKDEEFPATMPAFDGSSVRVSPAGEVWVLRNRAATDPVPTYDIFGKNGRRVGSARLRPHSIVIGFGVGSIYVSRQDPDDDLRYLERYAI